MNQFPVIAHFFFQELLLSSSDDSDDYDDDIREIRGPLELRPRIRNFVSEVVDNYSDEEFREHFRMFRGTFDHILSLIKNKISADDATGRHSVPPKDQLLLTLWYFGTPDCYRSICSRFNFGKATAIRTVRRVTEALLETMQLFIKWPRDDYIQAVKTAFEQMGFPNTIGVVDGCYIPIPTPKNNPLSYICRKNFAAIILQAVCDHQMLFTHCYVGEVGSTHDANVLRRSELYTYLTNRRFEKFENDSHLVADKAYPCLSTMMIPYKNNGHLTNSQKNFNYKLSCVRSTIERAFALLKKRFRCLKYFDIKDIEWACKYIMACCILHNICIIQNDIMEINEVEAENVLVDEVPVQENVNIRQLHRLGIQKRNPLCEMLNNEQYCFIMIITNTRHQVLSDTSI